MPHLSELANNYKGKVHFVAVSDEDVKTVETFLAKKPKGKDHTWATAMAYTVATDPDKSVKNDIFTAAGQRGIPSSFIIDDGKVMWIGHPMSMDKPLAEVVAGTFDIEAAKKAHAEKAAYRKMMGDLRGLMQKAMSSGDWEPVIAFLDQGLEKYPGNIDITMQKWNVLLLRAHRDEEAYALGNKLIEQVWDDASMLNQIAWTVVDDENVKTRDLKFALKVAARANELTQSKEGAILDTLARVHYESGRLDEAIRWQRRAVENAEGPMREQLEEWLQKYEAEKEKKKGGVR